MGRFKTWWSSLSDGGKAAYGSAIVGGGITVVGAIVVAVIQTGIPAVFAGDQEATTTTSTTLIDVPTTQRPTTSLPSTSSTTSTSTTKPPTTETTTPSESVFLASLDLVAGAGCCRFPVDQAISGKNYPQSIDVYCGQAANQKHPAWPVAGYETFIAEIGIADNEENSIDAIAEIRITDHRDNDLVPPFKTRLGDPKTIEFKLDDAVQLRVICGGRNATTGERRGLFSVTLGDAAIRR